MKKYVMKLKRWQKVFIGITTGMLAVTILQNGCSPPFKGMSAGDSGSSSGPAPDSLTTPDNFIPGAKTASVVDATVLLGHFSSCVGLQLPSDQTMLMFDAKKSAISSTGTAESVTSPMLMAITSVAGEICNDLIEQERAGGARIFLGVNLDSTEVPSASVVDDISTRLALSCWQRPPAVEEKALLSDMVTSVTAGEAGASRKTALMMCTAVLSSLDAILN